VGEFFHRLVLELRDDPAVSQAGSANFLPLQVGWRLPVTSPGAVDQGQAEEINPQTHAADGGWFDVMGARLVAGRFFDDRDGADGQPVLVVNRSFAERYWPGEAAVGKVVDVPYRGIGPLGMRISEGDAHVVVGVVEDIRNTDIRSPIQPAAWFPVRQFPFNTMHVVVSGSGDRAALADALRAALRRADPTLPPGQVRTLERVLGATADPPRIVMLLMGSFAVLALLLAAVGIYGILSYGVTQRRREIGIRMAVGARPGDVLRLVVGQGMALTVAGVLLGVAAAAAGGRLLSSLLYDVSPGDPVTLAAVMVVVVAVALLACALPALRAALRAALLRPMQSLGGE
jgi:predicted permease